MAFVVFSANTSFPCHASFSPRSSVCKQKSKDTFHVRPLLRKVFEATNIERAHVRLFTSQHAGLSCVSVHEPKFRAFLERASSDLNVIASFVELDKICLGGLWSEASYIAEVNDDNSDFICLISKEAPAADLLAFGCCTTISGESSITNVAVHPSVQRRGFGLLILLHLIRMAMERGSTSATLEVRSSNEAALQLYGKLGFRKWRQRKGYYSDGEDAVVLGVEVMREAFPNVEALCAEVLARSMAHGWDVKICV
mmetsp:Transcript_36404/g.58885  ORF Transcript_36404/g.58885 Transcript_36404/m.58885 type:complete len:254 (+) Transcript_36404:48-809(+)